MAKKTPATSTLSAGLEKTIEKDFQACEEPLRTGHGHSKGGHGCCYFKSE